MARLTSEFWVAAHIRRGFGEGAFATVVRKGSPEAGAIFVRVDRLDGTIDLYGPAPQSMFDEDATGERLFEPIGEGLNPLDVQEKFEREERMDPDFWVLDIEDREGRHFLDLAE
ncbi:DUF1491 family protein [Breoghania sp.]|uniref:DUF1491 family protein n=1 Tax=Breoghania sp. TaxID=2065378 RepID=UPI002631E7F0|nr:DUF1491 family protein [Breoghania sp.]MDJ0931810.1 DUF1491 family protein [Breoghania sp.]